MNQKSHSVVERRMRAAKIVSSYLCNNLVQTSEIPALVKGTYEALGVLGHRVEDSAVLATKATPAEIRKSITPDALISFIDGRPYKTLKRHLRRHGLDHAGYRARYGLPADYPSIAANYSAARAAISKATKFGRRKPEGSEPASA